jgi:hypothetical protein
MALNSRAAGLIPPERPSGIRPCSQEIGAFPPAERYIAARAHGGQQARRSCSFEWTVSFDTLSFRRNATYRICRPR